MKQGFEQRLEAVAAAGSPVLAGGLKGVEKEALRITPDGFLAQTPHPVDLGSALTNRYITTDFSEALLEFVTPAFPATWEALRFLCDIHQFTYARLGDELLWTASMPCRVPADRDIPLARYGRSNVGRMKTIYRRGLGHRYGREMQVIAGIHFNYSLPGEFWPAYRDVLGNGQEEAAFRSDCYLAMIRNFRRMGWIVLYLFGSSPAVCKSFAGAAAGLPSLDADTWYEPWATSLRMSDLGYSNRNQSGIDISLNSLDEYVRDLSDAICTPEPAYEDIGVKIDGRYRQLNANLLQIENEYYSPVRPKRVARSGEQPTAALRRGGIEYVEVRSLDISPLDPSGINQNTMRFVEAFLVYCLLEDSPKIGPAEFDDIRTNHAGTAKRGRDPDFRLRRNGEPVTLRDWASEILNKVLAVARAIDRHGGDDSYAAAVGHQQLAVDEPGSTPSARIVAELRDTDSSFFEFALETARRHRDYFGSIAPLRETQERLLTEEAAASVERQRTVEASDDISLDDYLQRYFSAC
ncbi:MAG: glutamate--cysteine ligase [Proteobacteria bacterium]|nr:glutamate--cysteine ligase [Pseudomonadota bacterium]